MVPTPPRPWRFLGCRAPDTLKAAVREKHDLLVLVRASIGSVQAEADQGPLVGHSSGDKAGSSSGMSPSAIEGMLLMAVEKLYKEDRELDVQMGLLRVVLQVLQRHGELCSSQT